MVSEGIDWGWMGMDQVRQTRKEGMGRGLKKSIRVRQGTAKSSVGSSQLEDQEVGLTKIKINKIYLFF